MTTITQRIGAIAASALLACTLAACSGNSESTASEEPETTAEERLDPAVRGEIEAAFERASQSSYENVSFSMETETTATGVSSGQTVQQSTKTVMSGELSKAEDPKGIHIAYEATSSTVLGKTQYDMYIDSERMIVSQGGQLYVDAVDESGVENYIASVTAIASADEMESLLDVASNYKMEERADDTVITLTLDVDKLEEAGMVDSSSLPEGSAVATMVASYTIDSNDRFTKAQIMSSTTGTPTYRVTQTYRYYDYDETELPEWPDLEAYIAEQSGILTDESGRMYIVDDDGQVYYIDSIDSDGTIHFLDTTGQASGTGGTDYTYYYYDDTATDGTTTTVVSSDSTASGSTSTSDSSSSDKGRAYITAYDGTIHYLDEEGSQIMDLGGTKVFIDADGEWYFLNTDDDEDLSEYM